MHRGDARRRQTRLKQSALVVSFLGVSVFVLGNRQPVTPEASAAPVESSGSGFGIDLHASRTAAAERDAARGEADLLRTQLDRANQVIRYSSQYKIAADMATNIVDVASAEGIDPELAFRLVKLESDFNTHATSPVGAVGLTQLMPATARFYEKGITKERLYDPNINLRIGFRYLRGLVKEYHGDVNLALLVYNRGPVAVAKARAEGDNPSNGYDRIVTRGYKGKGTVE